ncbi:unnamed protein product [Didymodactylos carnosus]|uniref:Uncharacterized protein n=1 Tax=Didymodactylos carnosus TaxID=1234261 RepID=A0A815WM17_9BILA|nr:unnamed protein product [Didymodactylos carnosus]CAF4408507.1 unnamed protein product [Didymodactylos carnosus]
MNELELRCVIGSNEQLNMKKQLEQNTVPQMNMLTGLISSLCSKLGQTGIIKVDEGQKSLSQMAQLEHLYQIEQKRIHPQHDEKDRNMHTVSHYASSSEPSPSNGRTFLTQDLPVCHDPAPMFPRFIFLAPPFNLDNRNSSEADTSNTIP